MNEPIHEGGHGLAARLAGHGPASWCIDPIEYSYGGGSKSSCLVDLAGILAELCVEFSQRDDPKMIGALLADPILLATEIGPTVSPSTTDYTSVIGLTDDQRAALKTEMQRLVVTFLVLQATGIFSAIEGYCNEHIKSDAPVSFLLKPGSALDRSLLAVHKNFNADLMSALYHAESRGVVIEAMASTIPGDATAIVSESIHVVEGHLSPVALAMIGKVA